MKIKIETGTINDLGTIAKFQVEMAKEAELLELDSVVVYRGVTAALNDPSKGVYYVAKNESGVIMGSLLITKEWSDWNNSYYWWIQSVYVRPEFRGQGVFNAMYQYVRDLAHEDGSTNLRLYVDKTNLRAQTTYGELGLTESHYVMFDEDL